VGGGGVSDHVPARRIRPPPRWRRLAKSLSAKNVMQMRPSFCFRGLRGSPQ
jgi:hypothetical protein